MLPLLAIKWKAETPNNVSEAPTSRIIWGGGILGHPGAVNEEKRK